MSFYYLATPYSKYKFGLMAAWIEACKAAAQCMKQGRAVYSPIAHGHCISLHGEINPLSHDFWLKIDEPMMQAAAGMIVVKMPGWQESFGIEEEIKAFQRMGKPIEYMEWPE